jgi:excisionase family DNA binding protein
MSNLSGVLDQANLRHAASRSVWMTYEQASQYTGYSVRYLRNLVSADQVPVYGPPRSRRFRKDMLDSWLTDRGAAMRLFRLEMERTHGG